MEYSNPVISGFNQGINDGMSRDRNLTEALMSAAKNANNIVLQQQQQNHELAITALGMNPKNGNPMEDAPLNRMRTGLQSLRQLYNNHSKRMTPGYIDGQALPPFIVPPPNGAGGTHNPTNGQNPHLPNGFSPDMWND